MSRRIQKTLKRKSKYMQTMIERYGEERAHQMILERVSKAGATKGKPKGFAVTGDAVEKARKSAEVRRAKV